MAHSPKAQTSKATGQVFSVRKEHLRPSPCPRLCSTLPQRSVAPAPHGHREWPSRLQFSKGSWYTVAPGIDSPGEAWTLGPHPAIPGPGLPRGDQRTHTSSPVTLLESPCRPGPPRPPRQIGKLLEPLPQHRAAALGTAQITGEDLPRQQKGNQQQPENTGVDIECSGC